MAVLSMLLVAALVPLFLWRRYQDSRSGHAHEDEDQVWFWRMADEFFEGLFICFVLKWYCLGYQSVSKKGCRGVFTWFLESFRFLREKRWFVLLVVAVVCAGDLLWLLVRRMQRQVWKVCISISFLSLFFFYLISLVCYVVNINCKGVWGPCSSSSIHLETLQSVD